MKNKKWSNKDILKSIKNPNSSAYETKIKIPELTFEGVRSQPDFATLYIFSYERLINVIYDDLVSVYEPSRLRLVMICNPRGGISSKLTIDSDWKIRGGEESFCDWVGRGDQW